MKRSSRITRSTDYQRVRRVGKSYAHPLMVLVVAKSLDDSTRVGLIAGKRVGGAVERNRVKRRLRAICHELIPNLSSGRDLIFIAREPLTQASFAEIETAVTSLLKRAQVYQVDGS